MPFNLQRLVRSWWWPAVCFVLFALPCVAWAFSSPVHAVPDEPDQVKRAVSLWDGQFLGPEMAGQPSVIRSIEIDGGWNGDQIPCFAFRPNSSPPDCPPAFPADDTRVTTTTYDGAFPPLFYALVGWPTRLAGRSVGFYGMRLVAALVSAALLASAAVALGKILPRFVALFAVTAAATPMVYFLAGSVNPSGLEISAAIALWAHVLAISAWPSRRPGFRLPRSLIVGLAIGGVLFVQSRFLSPGFGALIVVLGAATASRATVVSLVRDRRLFGALVAIGGAALAGFVLTFRTGALQGLGGSKPTGIDNAWTATLGATPGFVEQMIGWFGWLDTPISAVTEFGWLVVIGMVVGVALSVGTRRTLLVLAAVVGLTIAIPVVVQAPRLLDYGLTWQGRHGLPIAVGIPLVAIVAARPLLVDRSAGLHRFAVVGAVMIGVIQVHALWWSLHRYTVGIDATDLGLVGGRWQPPGGSLLWLGLVTAFGIGLVSIGLVSAHVAPARPIAHTAPAQGADRRH